MTLDRLHSNTIHNAMVLDHYNESPKEGSEKFSFSSSLKTLQQVELHQKKQAAYIRQIKKEDIPSKFFILIGEKFQPSFPRYSSEAIKAELTKVRKEIHELPKSIYDIDHYNTKKCSGWHVNREIQRLSFQLLGSTKSLYPSSDKELITQINNLATAKAKKRMDQSKRTGITVTFVALGVLAALCAGMPPFPNNLEKSTEV